MPTARAAPITLPDAIRKRCRPTAPSWLPTMATMIQLSIFAFALGGAALSFAYVDLIFCLFGLVLVIEKRLLPATLAEMAQNQGALTARPDSVPAPASTSIPPSAPLQPAHARTVSASTIASQHV